MANGLLRNWPYFRQILPERSYKSQGLGKVMADFTLKLKRDLAYFDPVFDWSS